jgi:hypothetical protein
MLKFTQRKYLIPLMAEKQSLHKRAGCYMFAWVLSRQAHGNQGFGSSKRSIMKVTEHIAQSDKTLVSFEILPPLKGKTINSIFDHLNPLMEFKPSFINVTYHRAEHVFKKKSDGTFEKVEVRKRPGTVGICAAIQNHYNIDAVPHLICGGFSKRETEDALIDLNFIGVQNVLVLRGDAAKNETFFEPDPEQRNLPRRRYPRWFPHRFLCRCGGISGKAF